MIGHKFSFFTLPLSLSFKAFDWEFRNLAILKFKFSLNFKLNPKSKMAKLEDKKRFVEHAENLAALAVSV